MFYSIGKRDFTFLKRNPFFQLSNFDFDFEFFGSQIISNFLCQKFSFQSEFFLNLDLVESQITRFRNFPLVCYKSYYCLSVCPYVCLSVCTSIGPSLHCKNQWKQILSFLCPFVGKEGEVPPSGRPYVRISVCPSFRLPIDLSICLSLLLSIVHVKSNANIFFLPLFRERG